MPQINKARYWAGVLYQENMRPGWKDDIDDILQVPFAYCEHTMDVDSKSEHRKDHVHLILAFPNTTTYRHALDVFDLLSADGKKAINTCQAINGIRNMYDYLIHDTDKCREKGKYQYPPEARITGNNFDIGAYEQLSAAEKDRMCKELCELIKDKIFTNFADFYIYFSDNYPDMAYFEVLKSYSGLFERLIRGNYQKWNPDKGTERDFFGSPSQGQVHEDQDQDDQDNQEYPNACPCCGSILLSKKGKTVAGTQRYCCKDCGKKFSIE